MSYLFAFVCLLLIVQLVYPFITVLLAQGRSTQPLGMPAAATDFACIITAYRNVEIALPLVESLLMQTHSRHLIYLVADECETPDWSISDERLVLLHPLSPLQLKAKSLAYALQHFRRPHEYVVVLDADNLAHPQFLETLNSFTQAGFRCVQGQRTAKNLDTTYAALDSMGEHYKNYIEREVPFLLGGAAVISGSGMATETGLYQAYLESPEIEQGKHQWKKMLQEDKILQNFLLFKGVRIAYARNAILFDEKVETGKAVETQRSRWIYSYFQNLPNAGKMLWKGISGRNWMQGYFGLVTLALPMFIQVGLALMLALCSLLWAPFWGVALLGALLLFAGNILWVLYLDKAPKEVWRAIWQVPRFMLRQAAGLLKMRDPNKHFRHTEHRKSISIHEIIDKETNR